MNASEIENCQKELDDILLCGDMEEIKTRAQKLKQKISENALGEKLWTSPYGNLKFLTAVIALLALSAAKLAFKEMASWDCLQITQNGKTFNVLDIVIYFLWLVGPPIFFLFEYTYLFGKNQNNRLDSLQTADIKYCQELGGKVWAAVVVCFSIILFIRYDLKF